MSYLIVCILLLILVEIIARIDYFRTHGMRYSPKQIGEYPYNEFIEECGPPLYWKLKPGYGKGQVHINSLGFRSAELQAGRKRIWVVGESELFGAKLACEDKIWFKVLQQQLDRSCYDYQVMNASVIGYNIAQAVQVVNSLPIENGDILLVRPNLNDVSIAYINGSDWQEGTRWPLAFIHKLERHKEWYFKVLDKSCLGTIVRRKLEKQEGKSINFQPKSGFQWEKLLEYQEKNLRQVVSCGLSRGAEVVFFDFSPSYSENPTGWEEARLSAIQTNWRELVEGWSQYQFALVRECIERVAVPMDLPVLRIRHHIWNNPKRYQLYLDLVHFNGKGHGVFARGLFEELLKSELLVGGGE